MTGFEYLLNAVLLSAMLWAWRKDEKRANEAEDRLQAYRHAAETNWEGLEEATDQLAELERQYAVQTEVIAEMEDKNAELRRQVKEMKAEKEKLMHELAGMQVHRDDSDDRIDVAAIEAENEELRRYNAGLEKYAALMQQQSMDRMEDASNLRRELAALKGDPDPLLRIFEAGDGGLNDGRAVTWGLAARDHHEDTESND